MFELFLSSILFLMDAHDVYEYSFSYTCKSFESSYSARIMIFYPLRILEFCNIDVKVDFGYRVWL